MEPDSADEPFKTEFKSNFIRFLVPASLEEDEEKKSRNEGNGDRVFRYGGPCSR